MATVGMRLSFWAMLAWVTVLAALVGGAGAWPTWSLAGREGFWAELMAGAVVLPIMLVSAAIVLCVASRGPAVVTVVFLAAGVVRLALVLAAAMIIHRLYRPPLVSFLVWLGLFYLAAITAEGLWLARALKRDAFLVALGRVNRP